MEFDRFVDVLDGVGDRIHTFHRSPINKKVRAIASGTLRERIHTRSASAYR